MNYKDKYSQYLKRFNEQLDIAVKSFSTAPELLKQAMEYAVLDGGKRIRPVLLMATAEMLGVEFNQIKEFAVAIECIHSYSLVHDDLPAMDNDDYRRGKLSTHKKFGEAFGILAGDALLNFAFEYVLGKSSFSERDAKALYYLANCSGSLGMIAGQVLDLQNEKVNSVSEQLLYNIYENKTAKLIIAPIVIASILSGGLEYDNLYGFAYNLGVMFQIADDILDVEGSIDLIGKTPNKDEQSGKLTAIKVFGLDGAKTKKEEYYIKCKRALAGIKGNEFLMAFTDAICSRNK